VYAEGELRERDRHATSDQPEILQLPQQLGRRLPIPAGHGLRETARADVRRRIGRVEIALAQSDILERVRKIEAVCNRHNVTLASAALQFPLAHPAVCSVIPGAKTAAEVKRNIATIEAPIPREFWAELKREKLIVDEAPVPV